MRRLAAYGSLAIALLFIAALIGLELLVTLKPFESDSSFFQFGDEP